MMVSVLDVLIDSIEHTFIDCPDSTSFFNFTRGLFNGIHNTKIDLTRNQLVCYMFLENLLTFNFTIPPKRRTDILLLNQKKKNRCKVLEKNLDLNDFINKIYLQWKLENCAIQQPLYLVEGIEKMSK